jgi:hypothetical protein
MSLGELLDGAFTLYRRHFAVLVSVAAICNGPFQAINIYANVSGGWTEHLGLLAIGVLIASVGAILGAASILRIVSDGYLGRETTASEALRFGFHRIGALMLAGFVKTILIVLACMLLAVPGIIVACGYAVVSQVVVLENPPNALDALGRSWALTKGHRWTVFALAFVLFLVASLPGIVAGMLAIGGLQDVGTVVGSIAALVLSPLLPCGITLFYYDMRIRKEAFDLQTLEHLIGGGAPA